jgi:hypothetical protein
LDEEETALMAYTQADLDKLDAAILDPTKRVTLSDGRSTEKHGLDELRRLRADVKNEIAGASVGRAGRRQRFIVARVGRCR